VGTGYVPGLNAVIAGAILATEKVGWEVVGIRDGYEGLLFPDRYAAGGCLELSTQLLRSQNGSPLCILGTAGAHDPLHQDALNSGHLGQGLDRTYELHSSLREQNIDSVIAIVGASDTGVAATLSRVGLNTVCIPKSIENDIYGTDWSFGFESALCFVTDILERATAAAEAAKIIAVVEVPGRAAGWLALQAAMSVCADVVIIPEIAYDLRSIAEVFAKKIAAGRPYGVIVVAEGAKQVGDDPTDRPITLENNERRNGPIDFSFVLDRPEGVAKRIARALEDLTGNRCIDVVVRDLELAESVSVIDRQLGLAYGASAVTALEHDLSGVMVALDPPDTHYVSLVEVANRIRTIPPECELVQLARALGMSVGSEDMPAGVFVAEPRLAQIAGMAH